ncbi:MAG: response regulator [Chthoniobacteraceae bacterium]
MRVLVVEDDDKIGSFVAEGLQQAEFQVDRADSGTDGLSRATSGEYDTAIVDLMLPGMGGLEMIAELRDRKIATPVIVLSAKRSVEDRVRCLEAGADDYVPKPFAFPELLARVHALIRRTHASLEPTRLEGGGVMIDLLTREVRREGRKIDLQPREFALLEQLVRHSGKVLSKTFLIEHLWDYSFDPQTNVVDVLVCRLRTKVDKDFDRKLIHTLRGAGYVFRPS